MYVMRGESKDMEGTLLNDKGRGRGAFLLKRHMTHGIQSIRLPHLAFLREKVDSAIK